jgi:DMSO/TMAO reductase YedYZ molybdopterin-dependent catalytic subunit
MADREMDRIELVRERLAVSRRYFLQRAGFGAAACASGIAFEQGRTAEQALAQAVADWEYLTKDADFVSVERGDPLPYTLPEPRMREIGMTRDTWKLEVLPDTSTGAKVDNPLSKERGNALDFAGLMKLAETKAVRYLKVITCNNLNAPLGMGLWEGVPLRDVIWMTRPVSDIRRVFYYGHHNEDPKQMFRGSLSIARIMEDPPETYPVMLCYKLNGAFLSGKRGGPVRVIAPENYGFKSVKWLQRVVLTNLHGANDTYAEENNDIDSPMKSFARFLTRPERAKAGEPILITGIAQAGMGGLSRVQYWLRRVDESLPAGDPYFTTAAWRDAQVLPAPKRWGGGLRDGRMPDGTIGFDASGRPKSWPMRYSVVHWGVVLRDVAPGSYEVRCRTIDSNGIAQPMPRPFGRSGINSIESVPLKVARG